VTAQNTDSATLQQTLRVSKAAARLIEFFFGGESRLLSLNRAFGTVWTLRESICSTTLQHGRYAPRRLTAASMAIR
jgi:hypothetical protein